MLRVRLVRAREELFKGTATQVVLPGEGGELSVLAYHTPMLCTLMSGEVAIDDVRIPVRGGMARVDRNIVTILVD